MSQEIEEVKKDEPGKVEKQFEVTLNKLIAIVGGKEHLRPNKKIGSTALNAVVSELLKEESERTVIEVKDDLKSLLKNYVELEKSFQQKEAEFKKLKQDKMKEFTEAAKKVFGRIDGLDQLEKDYIKALNAAGDATETA